MELVFVLDALAKSSLNLPSERDPIFSTGEKVHWEDEIFPRQVKEDDDPIGPPICNENDSPFTSTLSCEIKKVC